MAIKKWVIGKPDRELAKNIAAECDVDPFVALISVARGIEDSYELEEYLSRECYITDPRELADITLAADIINAAIEAGDKIAVYGDYDCDGVTSTAIMYDYLSGRGATVTTYIPDRLNEGYGMNKAAIDKLNSEGVKVIVTVDNGISSYDEIEYANGLGLTVVVTDHHIPPEILPPAAAIVDPKRIDCMSSFKDICGAEVAFKLCAVLDDKEPEEMIGRYADLLAIAVIGDVMPLVHENRAIVREGIKKIMHNPSVGVSAILNAAGVDRKTITSNRLSFAVTPRINAAGRMSSADKALKLLLCTDMLTALNLANDIDADNTARQTTEREISEEAFGIIENNGYQNDRVIVVKGENWHLGVTGIVASRICERYGKPAIVLSNSGDKVHGSGRSYEGFNLFDAIVAAKEHLVRYGGHSQAAGITLEDGKVSDFRKAINDYARKTEVTYPTLNIDFKLNPSALSVDMAHAIKTLEPFGNSNTVPLFALMGVTLKGISELSGGKHLKLHFVKGDTSFDALLFNKTRAKFPFSLGDTVDIAVSLDANLFRDRYTLSVFIKAIRMSGDYEEAYFTEKTALEDFFKDISINKTLLLPSREEIGVIFKEIKSENSLKERIYNKHLSDMGYAKTVIAVTVLKELNLIEENDGVLCVAENSAKTDLNLSSTYKKLTKGGYDF
ncbi:MAG: single-stranded-DNA-specific exonuclease RecJ [Clostridia bacterium]|nr:single-stranded-DNA-specific exonuclease RecJ [Clostridia bacterium]